MKLLRIESELENEIDIILMFVKDETSDREVLDDIADVLPEPTIISHMNISVLDEYNWHDLLNRTFVG